MRKISILFFTAIFSIILFGNFTTPKVESPQDSKAKLDAFPKEVAQVIEQKCYGSHNSESRNEDARKDLSFDKWPDLNALQKLSKSKDIHKEVSEEKMPPKKFLERFPDRKLTDKESKLLIDWASAELKK